MVQKDESYGRLAKGISNIKLKINNKKISDAKIFAILQKSPCLCRCLHEIQNPVHNNFIDPWYSARHDYAKVKIIDAIVDKMGDFVVIKSEHKLTNGRVDIIVLPDRIVVKDGSKVVTVEIKSGRSIDLFQIEQYLFDCDLLIIVRVPTRDVVVITRDLLKDELSEAALLLSRKAQKIEQGNLIKVQGDWCKGCPVTDCQFMEPPRWDGNVYTVSLQGSEEFIKNVSSVTAKILEILEKEFIQIAYAQETEYVHKS